VDIKGDYTLKLSAISTREKRDNASQAKGVFERARGRSQMGLAWGVKDRENPYPKNTDPQSGKENTVGQLTIGI